MGLALYRRHRRECKSGHSEELRTSEYDERVQETMQMPDLRFRNPQQKIYPSNHRPVGMGSCARNRREA